MRGVGNGARSNGSPRRSALGPRSRSCSRGEFVRGAINRSAARSSRDIERRSPKRFGAPRSPIARSSARSNARRRSANRASALSGRTTAGPRWRSDGRPCGRRNVAENPSFTTPKQSEPPPTPPGRWLALDSPHWNPSNRRRSGGADPSRSPRPPRAGRGTRRSRGAARRTACGRRTMRCARSRPRSSGRNANSGHSSAARAIEPLGWWSCANSSRAGRPWRRRSRSLGATRPFSSADCRRNGPGSCEPTPDWTRRCAGSLPRNAVAPSARR